MADVPAGLLDKSGGITDDSNLRSFLQRLVREVNALRRRVQELERNKS